MSGAGRAAPVRFSLSRRMAVAHRMYAVAERKGRVPAVFAGCPGARLCLLGLRPGRQDAKRRGRMPRRFAIPK